LPVNTGSPEAGRHIFTPLKSKGETLDISSAINAGVSVKRPVEPHMSALAMDSGGVEVLSTPWMIAMMECASREAVQKHLPEGYTTVGTRVDVRHTAPAFIGAEVTVESRVVEISGRTILFRVAVRCGDREVGSGLHERVAVNMEKFMSRSMKGVR